VFPAADRCDFMAAQVERTASTQGPTAQPPWQSSEPRGPLRTQDGGTRVFGALEDRPPPSDVGSADLKQNNRGGSAAAALLELLFFSSPPDRHQPTLIVAMRRRGWTSV